MININGFGTEYTIDLNKSDECEYNVTVNSRGKYNTIVPWTVTYTSSNCIECSNNGINGLLLSFDLENIKQDEYLTIENSNNEKARIIVKPNLKASEEKIYVFDIESYEILEKNKCKFTVKSTVNSELQHWVCTYNGKPYNYKISKNDELITLEMMDFLFVDIKSLITLTQEKSGKEINITLGHHPKSTMEVLEITKS